MTANGTFLLKYNEEVVKDNIDNLDENEGCDKAFDVIQELSDSVTSGYWIHDCFFYTNKKGKLNYVISSK